MDGIWDKIVDWGRDNLSEWSMIKVYVACAIAGGTVLLGQTGLSLFGFGGGDVDADVDVEDMEGGEGGMHLISIRTLSGFLTFFGLVGWTGTEADWHPALTAGVAFAAGASVMFFVAWIMTFFSRLQSDGNIRPDQAIGSTATVYLNVPGHHAGKGKITVAIQGRTQEFNATTAGEALPTGSACRIVRMTTEDTFEVAPLE